MTPAPVAQLIDEQVVMQVDGDFMVWQYMDADDECEPNGSRRRLYGLAVRGWNHFRELTIL
jgi:hypothetical protein